MKKLVLSFAAICAAVSLNAQILTANDGTAFSTWSIFDGDGDTENWGIYDLTSAGLAHAAGLGECAISFSYDDVNSVALTPDNLLISPVMNLTTSVNTELTFAATSLTNTGNAWFVENYSVYVVNALADIATATPLLTETIPGAATIYDRTVDLSAFDGDATVYVVFRHHNCTDQYGLVIDNVVVDGETLSINENVISTSVYPNPANDVLNIVASEEIANVSILGLDGKVVATSATSTVNVADLVSGMYIYEVTTSTGKVSRDSFMKK